VYPAAWVPQPLIPDLPLDEKSVRIYPNPLRGGDLTVHFVLGRPARVRLEAFDLSGRRMASLEAPGVAGAGGNQVIWHLASLAPGLYHIRLRIDGEGFQREFFDKLAVVR
jgi:hypothetical protein